MTTKSYPYLPLVFLISAFSTGVLFAQENLSVDYEKAKMELQKERETIFIEALQLSVSQAAVFHPIYVEFNKEKRLLDDQLVKLFVEYGNNYQHLNAEIMQRFVKKSERYQEQEARVRKKYFNILSKAISIEIGSQFYEVDDFISTSLRLNILTGLPFTGHVSRQTLNAQTTR